MDAPKGLAFTDVDVNSIKIAWEKAHRGKFPGTGWPTSPEDGIHELFPAPDGEEETAELQGLRPGSEYTVSVVALHDDMESQPWLEPSPQVYQAHRTTRCSWEQWLYALLSALHFYQAIDSNVRVPRNTASLLRKLLKGEQ